MHHMLKFINAQLVVELGTSLGVSTAYLAKANPKARIISLEGDPKVAALAKKNMKALQIENVDIEVGEFSSVLPRLDLDRSIDFLFLDGNHQEQPTLEYYDYFIDKMHPEGMIVVDDIYWSKGMTSAWAALKNKRAVRFALDFYDYGVLCLGKPDTIPEEFTLVHRWAKPWNLGFFPS